MEQKPKNSEIYAPLTLYFKRDNPMQMEAFKFLRLVGRNKTSLITKLINQYLKKNGIQSVINISKEQANSLISDFDTFNQESQQISTLSTNPEFLVNLLQELMNNHNIVQQVTEQPPMMVQPDVHSQERINRGRFGSKGNNIVQEQPISSPTVPKESCIPIKEPDEPIMEKPEEDYPDTGEKSNNATLMPNWAKGLDMFN